jgi:transposase
MKAVTPDKTEKQVAELIEAKSEILKLRAQLHRTEEERDILKKPRGCRPQSAFDPARPNPQCAGSCG